MRPDYALAIIALIGLISNIRKSSLEREGDSLNVSNDGASALQNLNYGYGIDNAITSITNTVTSSLSQSYGYDAPERLKTVTSGPGNQTFYWDNNGNKTRHVWTSDEFLTVGTSNNRVSSMGSHGYTYDGQPRHAELWQFCRHPRTTPPSACPRAATSTSQPVVGRRFVGRRLIAIFAQSPVGCGAFVKGNISLNRTS